MESRAELRSNAKKKLVERAKKDPAFKSLLLSDTRKAVEDELKIQLPSNVSFHVVQETAKEVYVVLPEEESRELSDKDLESVAGGFDDNVINMY